LWTHKEGLGGDVTIRGGDQKKTMARKMDTLVRGNGKEGWGPWNFSKGGKRHYFKKTWSNKMSISTLEPKRKGGGI